MSASTKEDYEKERILYTHRILVEVKKRPLLWRKNDPSYKNRMAAVQAWVEVGKAIGVTADTAKLRWRYLRDIFQKELKRIQKHVLEGGDVKDLRLWRYFRNMMFLKEEYADPRHYPAIEVNEIKPEPAQSEANMTDESIYFKTEHEVSNGESSTEDVKDGEYLQEFNVYADSNETNTSLKETSNSDDPKQPIMHVIEIAGTPQIASDSAENSMAGSSNSAKKRRVQETRSVEDRLQAEDGLDEDLLFVKSLVPYLKGLDPVRKLRLKSKIQILIADELEKS